MKEQIKAPEKIQLSNKEIANLSYAQFITLVIRMLTELVEFGRKLGEKMLRETKENVQGTNSDRKETGTQINGVGQKEERNIQSEKNEEIRIQKNEERFRNLQDIFKCSNIPITGVPEGEEEEQEIEKLFEKIMKENFPSLAKEIDLQDILKRSNIRITGVPEGKEEEQKFENLFEQVMKENFPNLSKEIRLPGSSGSSESPQKVGPKEAHTRAHHITEDER